jgi:hypothetical protein
MGRKVKIFRTLSQTACTREGLMGAIPQAVDEVPETLREGFGGSDDEDRRLVFWGWSPGTLGNQGPCNATHGTASWRRMWIA